MLFQAAPSPLKRTRGSGDYTMNSGSCQSTSTIAVPTIVGSSVAMSACSSTVSVRVRMCPGWWNRVQQGQGEGWVAGQVGRNLRGPDSPVYTPALNPA